DVAINAVVSRDQYLHVARDYEPAIALFGKGGFGPALGRAGLQDLYAVRLDDGRDRVFELDERQLYRVGDGVPGAEVEVDVVEPVERAEEIANAKTRAAPHAHA